MPTVRTFFFGLILAGLVGLAHGQKANDDFFADTSGSRASAARWKKYTDMMISGGQSNGVIERRVDKDGTPYLHIQGQLREGFLFPFMGFQAQLRSDGGPADWSAYKGVRLKARGDGKVYRLNVLLSTVRDHDENGKFFPTTKEWQTYEIPFDKLKQSGFGRRVSWDARRASGLGLHVSGGVMQFSFDIRDIELYR